MLEAGGNDGGVWNSQLVEKWGPAIRSKEISLCNARITTTQPVEFYRPWLGESLVYSCGYFRSPDDDLAAAQENKLELICRKLRLGARPIAFWTSGAAGEACVLHAALEHKVYARGITISREQAAVAASRIEAAQMTQSCGVETARLPARAGQSWGVRQDRERGHV